MLNTYGAGNADKMVVVFHRLGPYHFARLRALNQLCELLIIQAVKRDNTYAWNLTYDSYGLNIKTLFSTDSQLEHACTNAVLAKIDICLAEFFPDAIAVSGWSSKESLAMIYWCNRKSIPIIMMSESTFKDTSRIWYKEKVKSFIIQRVSSFLVGGKPPTEYARSLGVKLDAIYDGYDVVENSHFRKTEFTVSEGKKLRLKIGAQSGEVILACCRFVLRKICIDCLMRLRIISTRNQTVT